MPFLPALLGGLAAFGLEGAVIAGVTITATGAALISGLVTIAAQFALAPLLGGGRSNFGADQARGITQNISNPVGPLPVIYGTYRLAGTRVYCETTGDKNEFMHLVIAWCEGPINAITAVYFDDIVSTDGRYSGLVTMTHHLGADSQTADSALVAASSKWTSAHRLRGVAYTYLVLEYDPKAFPNIPVVSAVIEGKIVTSVTTGSSVFSNNPADCIFDYLTNTRYGRSIPSGEIDVTSFQTAAALCAANISNSPEPSQDTYTCDGVLDIDQLTLDNIRALLSSCRGYLIFSGGLYKLIVDQAEASAFAFTTANMVGGLSITLDSKEARFNRVKAHFYNDDRQWQPDLAILDSSTFRTDDNGTLLEREIELPFTTDFYRARRIAHLELKQSRNTITASFLATLEGLRAEVGDVVTVTHPTPGWGNKKFLVLGIELDSMDTVKVTCREYASIYTPTAPPTRPTATVITIPPPVPIEQGLTDSLSFVTFWQYSFEGGDVAGWVQAGGTIAADADACVGLVAGLVTHAGGGNVRSAYIPVSADFVQTALAVAGRQIRVQLWAKRPSSNAANGFKVRVVGNVNSSAWQTFTTTTSCAAYGFVWKPAGANTTLRLEIQGDSNNAGTGATLVDNIALFILPDFIDAATISTWIDTAAIGSAYIADLAVISAKIAALAVTTAKIADAAITNAKIGTAAVDTLTIAGQAVTFPISDRVTSITMALADSSFHTITGLSCVLPAVTSGERGQVMILVHIDSVGPTGTEPNFCDLRIMRDSTQVGRTYRSPVASNGTTMKLEATMMTFDTVNTSAHTYTVEVNGYGFPVVLKEVCMLILECKR